MPAACQLARTLENASPEASLGTREAQSARGRRPPDGRADTAIPADGQLPVAWPTCAMLLPHARCYGLSGGGPADRLRRSPELHGRNEHVRLRHAAQASLEPLGRAQMVQLWTASGSSALLSEPPISKASLRGPYQGVGHAPSPFPDLRAQTSVTITAGSAGGLRARLPGFEVECSGMGPAVVLGQDLGEAAGPVRDGPVADLAAGDRKPCDGHREAAGR
jgi:hypothetical protein